MSFLTNIFPSFSTGTSNGTDGVIDPPGFWCPDIDPSPIFQAFELLTKSHKWTERLAACYKCPVFKADPAWNAVLVTDHKAATQIFNSSAEDFDRDDGFLMVSLDYERMLNNVAPAVMIRDSDIHTKTRAFMLKVVHARGLDSLYDICSLVIREGLPALQNKSSLVVGDACAEVGSHIMFKWLMNLDGPLGSEVQQWNDDLGYTRGQSFICNTVLSQLKKRPGNDAIDRSKKFQEYVSTTPYFAEYQKFASDCGLPESHIVPNLLFACMSNSTSPCFFVGQPGIAKLYQIPELRARLEAEVRDVYDAREVNSLPLLDAFFFECSRWYGKPDRTARYARKDLVLTIGDGRKIQIRKGMSVHIIHSRIRADPLVFTDPNTFKPDRFIDDATLKQKLFLFGATEWTDAPRAFNCPGAKSAGIVWKTAVLSFLRDSGAKIEPDYSVDMDSARNRTEPKDIRWIRSTK